MRCSGEVALCCWVAGNRGWHEACASCRDASQGNKWIQRPAHDGFFAECKPALHSASLERHPSL